MQDNNSFSLAKNNKPLDKISDFKKYQDQKAKFVLYYYITGSLEQAIDLSGYTLREDSNKLVDWYKTLDLPEPMVATSGSDLVDSIALKLSTDDLAGIIAQAAKDGKDNRIATQLIDLYQERERQQAQLKFSKLDVERQVRAILDDDDFCRVLLTWLGREHIGRRLLTNPAYYLGIDTETLLAIQGMVGKELVKREKESGE